MGVVWKATDRTLGRDVAIKVLPSAVSKDPSRLARFDREAKVLASLNHANIAAIYSLHESDGMRFLAMEYIEGDDLTLHIARGLAVAAEVLSVARQVADGLEEAHEKGIVHRDLKPANIKITPAGKVKVLDFGLAKAMGQDVVREPADDSASRAALSALATRTGLILGTAAYMAPEQARGLPVDRRADIWSFGVLLFEMLSGQRPFAGATLTDVLAAVVSTEPDWTRLPADTPPRLERLIRRCLEKDPRQRLRDIGDARIELDALLEDASGRAAVPSPVPQATPDQRARRERDRRETVPEGHDLEGRCAAARRDHRGRRCRLTSRRHRPTRGALPGFRASVDGVRRRHASRSDCRRLRRRPDDCLHRHHGGGRTPAVAAADRFAGGPAPGGHRRCRLSVLVARQPVDWLLGPRDG